MPLHDESNRSVWLYSHSLAAIALCEAYGMTQDALLREPAQKSIDFIVAGRRTSDPVQGWEFEERRIDIDTPWETAIKKMFYRPSTFKVRDAFDLAAVVDRDGARLRPHQLLAGVGALVVSRREPVMRSFTLVVAGASNWASAGRPEAQRSARMTSGCLGVAGMVDPPP